MPHERLDWNDMYATGHTPWDSGRPSDELRRVIHEFDIKPCRALEMGCGTGTNAVYLAERGFDVTAFDLTQAPVEKAIQRAKQADVSVRIMQADALNLPDLGPAFSFVFDRGLYHGLRQENLMAFLNSLKKVCAPGALYLTLAGNTNEKEMATDQGPPRVSSKDLVSEFDELFELVQLREFQFDAVLGGESFRPLAWSALWRRKI